MFAMCVSVCAYVHVCACVCMCMCMCVCVCVCVHVCMFTCVYVQCVQCACMYMYVSNRHVCLLSMVYFKEGKELLFPSLRVDFPPPQCFFYSLNSV